MRTAIVLIVVGVLSHFGSHFLTLYFIEKRIPGLLETSRKLPPDRDGKLLWEHTAGLRVVPKWVSWVGLLTFPCLTLGLSAMLYLWLR